MIVETLQILIPYLKITLSTAFEIGPSFRYFFNQKAKFLD